MFTDLQLVASVVAYLDQGVRFLHLISVAVGFGTVISTDILSLSKLDQPVTGEYRRGLEIAHGVIVTAFVVAWATGLALVWLKTGFDPAQMTVKLWVKLAVVSQLTLTAYGVKRLVMPILRFAEGQSLVKAPRGDKIIMAICAGLSIAGWSTALTLGGLAAAATMPGWLLIWSVAAAHVIAVTLAVKVACFVHNRVNCPKRRFALQNIRGY
ncbi:MAG: hypothetical protein AAF415_14160 [Pseudomonadota bacterium]